MDRIETIKQIVSRRNSPEFFKGKVKRELESVLKEEAALMELLEIAKEESASVHVDFNPRKPILAVEV